MSDAALQLLSSRLAHLRGRTVWVVDEQLAPAQLALVAPRPGLIALGNRCDAVHALQLRGFTALLGDFSFEPWAEQSLDAVAYRISKEKAVVHHVINAALQRLRPGGELWLAGGRSEGIKTYLEKAARCAGGTLEIERHGAVWLGVVTRGAALGGPLDDQRYAELRELEGELPLLGAGTLWSKPGIYGWQKIDAGSALLAGQLGAVWPRPPASVLDLGCGYGYLSLCAARVWPDATIVATDNNVAAIRACEKNLAPFGARASAVLADCAAGIDAQFDAVLCNPPFHQGFEVEADLTTRFLQAARRRLHKKGRALFVVNQFIALERKAAPLFRGVREISRAQGFKLIALEP